MRRLTRRISWAWIWMSAACPLKPPLAWWISTRVLGREWRRPCAPPASRTAAMDAARPMQMVPTRGSTYCMVS